MSQESLEARIKRLEERNDSLENAFKRPMADMPSHLL